MLRLVWNGLEWLYCLWNLNHCEKSIQINKMINIWNNVANLLHCIDWIFPCIVRTFAFRLDSAICASVSLSSLTVHFGIAAACSEAVKSSFFCTLRAFRTLRFGGEIETRLYL